jgi:hypothetical protein
MYVLVHVHVLVYGVCLCLYSCCMEMSVLNVHVQDTGLLSMLHVYVHAACPCSCCMSMSMLHIHVYFACPCPYCISILCSCCMSTLHVHVHATCLCSCCMSMFVLCSCLWPCCMTLPMMHVHVRAPSLHYCPCPCTCCISMSMLLVHLHAARLCGLGRLESFWILYATMVQWLPTNNITFGNMILSGLFYQFYQSVSFCYVSFVFAKWLFRKTQNYAKGKFILRNYEIRLCSISLKALGLAEGDNCFAPWELYCERFHPIH